MPSAYVVVRSTYVCELSLEVTQFTNLPDAYRAFIAATLKVSKINDGGEDLLSCLSDENKCENCGDMEPCLPSCLAAKKIVALKSGDNEIWKFFNFECGRGDDVVRVRNGCLSLSSAADDGVRGESRLIPIYSSDQSSIDKARVKRSRPEEMAERVQERIDDRDSFNFVLIAVSSSKKGTISVEAVESSEAILMKRRRRCMIKTMLILKLNFNRNLQT